MATPQDLPSLPQNARLALLPPADAVEFFARKGLKRTTDWRDLWQDEHAQQFTVAKLARLDLLQAVRDGIDAALTEGITLREFQKRLTPVLQKAGWWGTKERVIKSTGEIVKVNQGSPQRLALIYDVNLRTAYAAGRWQRIQANKAELGLLVYRTMRDARVRPLHRQWDGVALPVDHSFWLTHYAPNGWRCRCMVYATDGDGLDALRASGLRITQTAPHIEMRKWLNHLTGEVMEVPFGIDPGWAYNPGIAGARASSLQQTAAAKLASASNELALPAVDDLVRSPAFSRFYQAPTGNFPVAVMDTELQALLKVNTPVVQLSAQTLVDHKARHPEIGLDTYRLLPAMVRNGLVISQGNNKLVFVRQGATLYKTVVKATAKGDELYVLTLYQVSEREIERDLKRGKLVREWK